MINGYEVNGAEVNSASGGSVAAIPIPTRWIATHYKCVLTGAQDGLGDLVLPISSFVVRINPSSSSSYVQAIVPGVDVYVDEISARSNGQLVISRVYVYLDGSSTSYEMTRGLFETLRTDTGGKSGTTGTLQGYWVFVSSGYKEYLLVNPTYRSWDGETVRYRCELDPRVRPGDSVTINEETLTVVSVQHSVDVKLCLSEISGTLQ